MASAATATAQQPPSQHRSSHHSSSKSHRDAYDRFYGHRDLAELCERVIMTLFACPLDSTASSVATSANGNGQRPAPRLSEFIAYALHRTRLPLAVTHQALFLLKRLKSRFPAARGSSGHRLFISALMLASKSTCDDTYSNKSWTIVGQGLFSLREVNQMERELFGYLGFKVNVENEELIAFVAGLDQGVLQGDAPPSAPPTLRVSIPSPALAAPEVVVSDMHSPMPVDTPSFHSAPAQEQSLAASPNSSVGPHRPSSSHRSSRYGAPLSSRASIAGYPQSSHALAAAAATATVAAASSRIATSHLASASAPSLHIKQNERPSSAHSHYPHAFGARERSRPYTMPTHPMQLTNSSSASLASTYYAPSSPAGSMSSDSMSSCGSLSAGSSSSVSSCPTPSSLSRSDSSGRNTPDTPPSDYSSSPWQHRDPLDCDEAYYGEPSPVDGEHVGIPVAMAEGKDANADGPRAGYLHPRFATHLQASRSPSSHPYGEWA